MSLMLNREQDQIVEIRTSLYALSPRTPHQREMLFLLGPIKEDDCILVGTSLKDELMVPDT